MRENVPGTVWVSRDIDLLVLDLELALLRLAAADPKDREEVENAYTALNQRRKELYARIAELEGRLGVPRTVIRRF